MKKITLLFTAIFALAFGATVSAQGTGDQPSVGYEKSYWVNVDTDNSHDANHAGNEYTWQIFDIADMSTPITSNTYFQVSGITALGTATANEHKINITWTPASTAKTFILTVKEEDVKNGTGCSNLKAMKISPQNRFAITLANIDSDLNDLTSSNHCAPDVRLTISDADEIVYNYEKTTLYYKVSASGINSTAWSFDYKFSETGKDAASSITATYGTDSNASKSLNYIYDEDDKTITALGNQPVIIKVVIDNGTNAEGKVDHNIVLTLSNFSDGANAPATINGVNVPGNTDALNQTVKARPNTSDISSN